MNPTIGIDYRPALTRVTGVGRYVDGLTRALALVESELRFVLFSSSYRDRVVKLDLGERVHFVDRRIPVRLLNWLWHRHQWPSLELVAGTRFSVTHSPTPLLLPSRRAKRIVTIHDLFFLTNPEATTAEIRRDYVPLVREHASAADAVVTVSKTTAASIREHLDVDAERIHVVHNGLDKSFFDNDAPRSSIDLLGVQKSVAESGYILVVATLEPRKNLPRFIEAVAILQSRGFHGSVFLVGGDGPDSAAIEEAISRFGLSRVVRRLGYVSPENLAPLYRSARLVVMPSIWEGFGLPLLEAMASSTPVAASDIPAHREVCSDAAEYFDPSSAESMAECIHQLWTDPERRAALVRRGDERAALFSWLDAAEKMVEIYRSLCGS